MRSEEPVASRGGPAAAILAAGVGCFALGLLTVLAEKNRSLGTALRFSDQAGDISGITIVAVLLWLIAWAGLHGLWRHRDPNLGQVLSASLGLIALGCVGTFPPFFQAISR